MALLVPKIVERKKSLNPFPAILRQKQEGKKVPTATKPRGGGKGLSGFPKEYYDFSFFPFISRFYGALSKIYLPVILLRHSNEEKWFTGKTIKTIPREINKIFSVNGE